MLQHDLRVEEIGRGTSQTPRLVAWCICGGWAWVGATLDHSKALSAFVDHHLGKVMEERAHAYKHVDTIARYLYLTP